MRVLRTAADLAEMPPGTAFVPTMGALHEGHLSLVRHAVASNAGPGASVSIFVNPTQFNDPADLDVYPRDLDADLDACRAAGARWVFAPEIDAVYPPGAPDEAPPLPPVATEPGLEDRCRPGHFLGVCRVVRRLFELVRPVSAHFGEKDWQQLRVVRAMTLSLGLGVDIIPVPTVREPDGLAMSSRNRHLTAAARAQAVALSRSLAAAGAERDAAAAEAAMRAALAEAGVEPEYAVVREAAGLVRAPGPGEAGRALVAAPVGSTRLLDNMPWPL